MTVTMIEDISIGAGEASLASSYQTAVSELGGTGLTTYEPQLHDGEGVNDGYDSFNIQGPEGQDSADLMAELQSILADDQRDDVPEEIEAYYRLVLAHPLEGDGGTTASTSGCGSEKSRPTHATASTDPTSTTSLPHSPAFASASQNPAAVNGSDSDGVSPKTLSAWIQDGNLASRYTDPELDLERRRAAYDRRRSPDEVMAERFGLHGGPVPSSGANGGSLMPSPLRIRKAQSAGAILDGVSAGRCSDHAHRGFENDAASRRTVSVHSCNASFFELAPLARVENHRQRSASMPLPYSAAKQSWIQKLKSIVLRNWHSSFGSGVESAREVGADISGQVKKRTDSVVQVKKGQFPSLGDIRARLVTKFRRSQTSEVVDAPLGISEEGPLSVRSVEELVPCSSAWTERLRAALQEAFDELEGRNSVDAGESLL